MSKGTVKLSYISGQYRIRAQITKNLALSSPTPPDDVILRAQKKMSSVKKEGDIDFFSVYKSRFTEFWQLCAKKSDLPPHEPLNFTLAEGSPKLDGIKLEPTEAGKAIATLSVDAPSAEVKGWRIEWLIFYINHQLKTLGINNSGNPAQIYGAYLKVINGEPVQDLPLGGAFPPSTTEEIAQKPYSIIANKARKEVTLVIRNISHVVEKIGIARIIEMTKDASEKVSEQFGGTYQVLRKEITAGIQQALNGPELLGQDIPLVILAASGSVRAAAPPPPVRNTPKNLDYPGVGKLNITVTSDAMEASISDFSMGLYQSGDFNITDDWLKNEIARHGISEEMSKPYIKELSTSIIHKENLDGMVVAFGIKSQGGGKPYLHSSFKEAVGTDDDSTDNVVDIRNLQQKSFVKTGQLVASVHYQNSPKTGKNVYGEDLEPAKNADFYIEVGEGIEERADGKYYATFDGVPLIGKTSISLTKTMVHKGDVNLRTGNITFDGPVEVTGSIDTGSVVHVTGNLTVKGSIRNAFIRCGGDLEVANGIVTGRKGLIHANGNVRAEFIENSTIQCGGSVIVKKAVLNCDIIAGGKIELLDKEGSVIAGGSISCRENLYTGSLGFKNGNVTELNTGVDWKTELSVRIRTQRIEKVQEVQAKDRQTLREVLARKKSQMTEKHENRKKYYQERLVKCRELLERMRVHLENARAQLVYDQEVKVFVAETLYANVKIHVGGTPVLVTQDTAGVALLGKRKRGSKIIPIETAIEMERDRDEDEAM